MKLSLFTGGLDIRKNPKLIQPHEAVEIENVDTSTGVLKAAKGKTATSPAVNITNKPFYYNGGSQWMDVAGALDYLEYQEKLYYTTATLAKKYDGTNTYNLGITAPTSAPTVSGSGNAVTSFTASALPFSLVFDVEYDTNIVVGAATTNTTYTFTAVVYGVTGAPLPVIYVETKTVKTPSVVNAELKLTASINTQTYLDAVSGSNANTYSLAVFTPSDYSSFLNNTTGVTVTVGSVPTLSSGLLGKGTYTFGIAVKNIAGSYFTSIQDVQVDISENTFPRLTILHNYYASGGYYYTFDIFKKTEGEYEKISSISSAGTSGAVTTLYVNIIRLTSTSASTVSGLNGAYQYCYTFYNNSDGTESVPSPLSNEFRGRLVASLTSIQVSADPQVTHKKIYRIGGTLSNFIHIATITNATTAYSDTAADLSLTGNVLDCQYNDPAPSGLRYLKNIYGVFVGAVGDKFHFTRDIGNPNYWPATYYIDFPATITGIGNIGNNLIVFTRYQAWLISGSSATTFVPIPLRGDQGCINHDTIADMNGQLLWVSTDGICITSGSNLEVLSKNKLGKQTLSTINAAVIDEAYYLQLNNGKLLVFDSRYEPNFKYFDADTDYVINVNDTLYGRAESGTLMSTLFTNATVLTYTYKTGELTEGEVSNHKTYNKVYVHSDDVSTMYIYISGTLVATRSIVAGLNEVLIPQASQRGYYIQFKFIGVGTINEVEYKVMSRTTGD